MILLSNKRSKLSLGAGSCTLKRRLCDIVTPAAMSRSKMSELNPDAYAKLALAGQAAF